MVKNYHFIAIGGSIMHNLAIDLHLKGHEITGSDDRIYDPARRQLANFGLLPEREGWAPEKIKPELDAVILGMHAREDNPELKKALALNIPVFSFPEFIYRHSREKKRIVVAGSHGKTTISSMIMHLLKTAGRSFDYLVGARLDGFQRMVQLSDAPVMVIEGDEYLSSRLDKRPKFLHYDPDICIISGIAWDHMNVFPTWEKYLQAFRELIQSLSKDALLIYNDADDTLKELVKECPCPKTPYRALPGYVKDGIHYVEWQNESLPLSVFGTHNLENWTAAIEAGKSLKVEPQYIKRGLVSFTGASMRLEKIFEHPDTSELVLRDFAHAPSKVKASVKAVRELYPDRPVVAVFELHTFSSITPAFINEYYGAFDPVDQAIVFYEPATSRQKRKDPLKEKEIQAAFGDPALLTVEEPNSLKTLLKQTRRKNACYLLMSSGRFGGLDLDQFFRGNLGFTTYSAQ